jgi:NADPH2:quinone reductase
MEAAGEVERVGEGVAPSRVGERVVVGTQSGCYAEKVRVPSGRALPAVPSFSLEENAAFPVQYLTAWASLFELARLRASDTVLVTAAAGGLGTAAVQLASKFGCVVIGAAGSAAKLDTVSRMGAAHAITYEGLRREVRAVTGGRGVDVALESVGGEVYRGAVASLAPLGRVVVVGFAGVGEVRRWNPVSWWRAWRGLPRAGFLKMLERSYGVMSTHIGILLDRDPGRVRAMWDELVPFAEKHGIRPVVGARFPFEEMPEAHELLESRESVGKVVVTVP